MAAFPSTALPKYGQRPGKLSPNSQIDEGLLSKRAWGRAGFTAGWVKSRFKLGIKSENTKCACYAPENWYRI